MRNLSHAEALAIVLGDSDEPEQPMLIQAPAYEPMSSYYKFIANPELVDLFLHEVERLSNSRGEISSDECTRILRGEFNFPAGTGSAEIREAQIALQWVVLNRSGQLIKITSGAGYRVQKKAPDVDVVTEVGAADESLSELSDPAQIKNSGVAAFLRNMELVQSFIGEAAKLQTPEGVVPLREAIRVLREMFGFTTAGYSADRVRYQAPYTIIDVLSKKGFFSKIPSVGIRFVVEDTTRNSDFISDTAEQFTLSGEPLVLAEKFKVLSQRVKDIRKKRAELLEIEAQKTRLEERQQILAKELAEPSVSVDEASYDAIVQLIQS